jgi:hypothetical protein
LITRERGKIPAVRAWKGGVGVAMRRRLGALFVENFAQKHRPGRARAMSSARVRESQLGFPRNRYAAVTLRPERCVCGGKKNGEDARRPRRRCRRRRHRHCRCRCRRRCRRRRRRHRRHFPSGPPLHSSRVTAPSSPANFFQMLAPSARSTPELLSSFPLHPLVLPLSNALSLLYRFTLPTVPPSCRSCPSTALVRLRSRSSLFVLVPTTPLSPCFLLPFVREERPCGRVRREKGR